ncbi:hypothetical protein HPY1198_05775 [Helicobacter pylori]|nr:hypothetical protein HPY1198_05775 [Helicobacter pylori]
MRVLRVHASYLCVKNGYFLLKPSEIKKKDFHGINKILRIFMIKPLIIKFFLFLLLNNNNKAFIISVILLEKFKSFFNF